MFLFASTTDTFGQVIIEAQASGLPVVAVAAGGPAALVEDRVTGLLCRARAARARERDRSISRAPRCFAAGSRGAALASARGRTWERTLERLAIGYRRALDAASAATSAPAERGGGADGRRARRAAERMVA